MECLSDVQVAEKKLFLIQGDKPQLMNWEKYGLRIGVQEESLSSSETVEAAVVALVGGQFQFPPNTVLVSAVYAVSLSEPLLKRLKLEIQHCVDLTRRPDLAQYLKFAIAPVSTPSLPYQFSIVEGGDFSSNGGYGFIERKDFCLVCILGLLIVSMTGGGGGRGGGQQQQGQGAGVVPAQQQQGGDALTVLAQQQQPGVNQQTNGQQGEEVQEGQEQGQEQQGAQLQEGEQAQSQDGQQKEGDLQREGGNQHGGEGERESQEQSEEQAQQEQVQEGQEQQGERVQEEEQHPQGVQSQEGEQSQSQDGQQEEGDLQREGGNQHGGGERESQEQREALELQQQKGGQEEDPVHVETAKGKEDKEQINENNVLVGTPPVASNSEAEVVNKPTTESKDGKYIHSIDTVCIVYILLVVHSTGVKEATNYAGLVYYEEKGIEDLITFTAAKKLDALLEVIHMYM